MKARLLLAILFAVTLGAGPALAQRVPVPIIDHPNLSVANSSGKPLQADQVKQAIQEAAKAKGWSLAYEPSGRILATLVVRNKHTVVVEIAYAPDKYSIMYKDSVNMKYAPNAQADPRVNTANSGPNRSGYTGGVIHPFYNSWVGELKEAIRVQLLRT
jgi:hypothetical protein